MARTLPRRTVLPAENSPFRAPLHVSQGSATVDVLIGDGEPVRFLIDTGAQACAIPSSLAEHHGLETRTSFGFWAGASRGSWQKVRIATLPAVEIAGASFEGVEAVVVSDDDLDTPILGFGLFGDVGVTLDFPNAELIMEPLADFASARSNEDSKLAQTLSYSRVHDCPAISIVIGGVEREVLIDTGCSLGLVLPRGSIADSQLHAPEIPIGRFNAINGGGTLWMARLRSDVEVAGLQWERPIVAFGSRNFLLGMGVLGSCSLSFDPSQQTVTVRRTSTAAITSDSIRGYGYVARRNETGQTTITSLLPLGPALRAGLRVGDIVESAELVQVDDRDVIVVRVSRGGEVLTFHVPESVLIE